MNIAANKWWNKLSFTSRGTLANMYFGRMAHRLTPVEIEEIYFNEKDEWFGSEE